RGGQIVDGDVVGPDGGPRQPELLRLPRVTLELAETCDQLLDDSCALPDWIRQAEDGEESRRRRRQRERLGRVDHEFSCLLRWVSPPTAEGDVVQNLQSTSVVVEAAELVCDLDEGRGLHGARPARLELLEVPQQPSAVGR